ncbi:LysM domain-containing protein [Streptococcus chenjunshii]|uniref:LysM domain-containing protein n=1 Tax=Streptococcus chenjunshii TaxID=2173853 RepID=A0A372KMC0_9STRE|nr:LysM peptidoglycan-binding domain-containing protein [Streptococcus chenjunshii]AXQ79654.1 LysM domain-containing protein [Streptococcus chenjunshii]RFU51031.1 LysM domain-containing protein [Streptococcus chenjunshii]RFU53074.1 LysM domain-containing protein [Streptococcus chenjunshii]
MIQAKTILNNKGKTMKLGLTGIMALTSLVLPIIVKADSYTVQSGDTLSAIAAAHNTTVTDLAEKNGISDANSITVGQTLSIDNSENSGAAEEETAAPAEESGLNTEDAAAKEEIAQHESGGDYTAQNGQYYGRYQLSVSYLNGDLSAENQERVADNYVNERYGSWTAALAFWHANGWY